MTETNHLCPNCRKHLPTDTVQGLCPECLIQAGFGTDARPEHSPRAQFHPPDVAQITKLFPQLEITGLIGKGGMGAVYKARQPALDRWVALKILPPQTEEAASPTARFNREARALAHLSHPNIVAVYDFGQADDLCYFVMEYVDGASLRQLLRAGRISSREALQIIPQICDALQYAHDEGVVHRDIKPENVLVDRKGRVKIADFGLAKIMGCEPKLLHLTAEGQRLGTPHYMAPEQLEHPQTVDHRADIYSLGVVFYELLTGELPLGKFQPPSQKAHADARLDDIVMRALEKEPDRRYQHASEVRNDVDTIASTPPSATRPTSTKDAMPSWVTAARWTARALGTLMLAGFVAMLLFGGMQPLSMLGKREQIASVGWGLALLGFLLGWRLEGAAALLISLGWAFFPLASAFAPRPYLSPLPLYLVVAALYALCWWASHGRKTKTLAGAGIAVTAALISSFVLAAHFGVGARIPPRDPRASPNLVDLTPYYNAALGENWMDPRDNRDHLGELPTGLQRLAGTEFDIRGLIQVERQCPTHPPRINGIAVGKSCQRLHFLHAARNAALLEDGLEVGRYVVHFASGEQREIRLLLGRDLVDWHIQPRAEETYMTAWSGFNPKSRALGKHIRLFKTTWQNPSPDVQITSIDFVASCPGPCPFLIALTAE